jgi:hypothetical protein
MRATVHFTPLMRALLVAIVGLACVPSVMSAQDRPTFRAIRVASPPRIDGLLDDEAWREPPLTLGTWRSYNPIRGDEGPETTEVRVAFDERFIYVAFNCRTGVPDRIRTTVSRRDTVFNDDWVGLSLDSTGTGQSAYHLMVNPSGIQMDAVNTTAAGEKFESDFLWYSAGARTADGYSVELALPLETLRFSAAPTVTMGLLFWRHVSYSGMSYSWPDMPSGQWVFDRNARITFDGLTPRRLVELLPSATLPVSQTRLSPDRWNEVGAKPDFGIGVKYGITSELTLDATVNPDFSQVESDAFQVQMNQRFPVFFSEKRPFFMEGIGLFSVAGAGGDSNMRSAVHTRRIVNPAWGAKLTGTAGKFSLGVLEASDESPDENVDEHKLFSIGRMTYSLGGADYIGAIVTDTERDGRYNRVLGGDVSWKPSQSQTIASTYLVSTTSTSSSIGGTSSRRSSDGGAGHLNYTFDTRRYFASTVLEHYDEGFQMDTAFYNRTGFSSAFLFSEVNFYPEKAKRIGLIRIHPLIVARKAHDSVQGGSEQFLVVGSAFNFSRQGFLRVQHDMGGHEHFAGHRFRTGDPFAAFGNIQLFRWLNVGGNFFKSGWQPFYDPDNPYQGRATTGGFELTWQPNQHFNQNVSYSAVRFRRADTNARVFDVNIINAKAIYQFDRHFLIRLVEQFDSSRHQLLTDLLASYELVPGSVLHAGYGSLYEQRRLDGDRLVTGAGDYLTVSRGLFFKASYLHRF